jgi:hypothetical protein
MALFGSTHIFGQWLMLLWPNYWARMAGFALIGFSQLKNNVSYTWLFESVESRHKSSACSVLNAFDTLTMAITCFYFLAISRNWFWLYFTMTVLATFSFMLTMAIVPESPKWLLINGRREDAIKALNWIGKINGSKTPISDDAVFVESNTVGLK